MNLKQELRQILHNLAAKCGYDNYVTLNGKKYRVGKMSYDEYFIEPYRKGRTERDPFPNDTLWEKSDEIEIIQLLMDDDYLSVTIN